MKTNENVTKGRKKGLKELKNSSVRYFKAKRQFQYQFIDFWSLFYCHCSLHTKSRKTFMFIQIVSYQPIKISNLTSYRLQCVCSNDISSLPPSRKKEYNDSSIQVHKNESKKLLLFFLVFSSFCSKW